MRLPDSWSRARVTLALTVITAAVWVITEILGLEAWAANWGAFIPSRVGGLTDAAGTAPVWLTPLTATLIHAGFLHFAFNMLFLVFCGRPTEAVVGPVGLLILYIGGAYAAAAAHYLMDPSSEIYMVGASGAISAVLGAYAILFGRNKVKVANPKLAVLLNALWLMAAWIVLQLIVVFTFAGFSGGTLQIAIGAHIGGFILGVALANPLLLLRYRKA